MIAALLGACISLAAQGDPGLQEALDEAEAAVAKFEPQTALALLDKRAAQGPLRYADNVRFQRLRGVALASLNRSAEAREAFDHLLSMDPGHAITYTLGPKVTFVFEEARRAARKRRPPTLHLGWQRDRAVDQAVDVTVETVSDPAARLGSAVLRVRIKGTESYHELPLDPPAPGAFVRVSVPPMTAEAEQDTVLQFYLVAMDHSGNEVLQVGSTAQPFEVVQRYIPPPPWHARWWVWAGIGSGVALTVATGVALSTYAYLQATDSTVDGALSW